VGRNDTVVSCLEYVDDTIVVKLGIVISLQIFLKKKEKISTNNNQYINKQSIKYKQK